MVWTFRLSLAAFAAASVAVLDAETFTKDMAPILQAKCQECHRKGSMAPMAFTTFEETRPWAKAIRERVVRRQMPPWHIDKTVGIQHFTQDRSLSDVEIKTITAWVDAGAPKGDPKHMPPPVRWNDETGWKLAAQFGPPDLVVKSEPYTMPAHGQDQWWKPVTKIPLDEPRWVRAVELRPATAAGRRITHHVLARLLQDEPPANSVLDQLNRAGRRFADRILAKLRPDALDTVIRQEGPGMLMEWAIGKNYDIYRPGAGKLLLPGSRIWWEIHYHAVGEPITNHAELAIYLYPKGQEPNHRTFLALFQGAEEHGNRIDIPPNSVSQTQGFTKLRLAARIENFQPHMHLRGKAMSMEAILPDGSTRMLSRVDRFNFNWMINYIYADDAAPVLPKGTVIRVTAWHDNTRANPNNPDPDQWVGFGDRTVDEMAHAWANLTYLTEEEYRQWLAKRR